jgi:hypothetical protein
VNQELSGQMLSVRTGKRRMQMVYQIRRRDQSITADIHPKSGSALWALGSGMLQETLSYRMRVRSLDVRARVFKNGKRRRKVVSKGYVDVQRRHHLRKVPFMEASAASHRSLIQAALQRAVDAASAATQAEMQGGEGI